MHLNHCPCKTTSLLFLCTAGVLARLGDREGVRFALHERPLLHIAILSATNNRHKRDACRNTWIRDLPSDMSAVFMVLAPSDKSAQDQLFQESILHKDIHFVRAGEGYYQIPYSTMSAVASASSRASFIMKCDDDTFVHVQQILERLRQASNPTYWVWGTISSGARPNRSGKWAITRQEYPADTYPPYPHGPGYILSANLAAWLASHPLSTFMKFEDVAMGMWIDSARRAGVPVVMENGNFPLACSTSGYIAHYIGPAQMHCLYLGRKNCCNL